MNTKEVEKGKKGKLCPQLFTELAATEADVRESQALRYRIFSGELGARLHTPVEGLDIDRFDDYCHHLLVRSAETGEVVASTRLLSGAKIAEAGGFYSEGEFDLTNIKNLGGRILEVGRTCVAPAYRTGAAIGVLWSGLGAYINLHGFDYLCGCASIELEDDGVRAAAIMKRLRQQAMSCDALRVNPLNPLPPVDADTNITAAMPPLLKAYIRLGAKICGEPCWDPDFNVADVFILVKMTEMDTSYARHFFGSERVPVR
ncbi:MAG: GNAT family N-acetyltransferase [Gammaproteobacteria bacterium]|nr:GNAT family N-acetyltransferase [Gammaproteobacteria bacterium]MBU1653399.1 GNAT family N-acetyltransferase [Gammaproteobacteria bacterium]MBU1960713.1 GNAT family N-acetyltransferase [Gammaproteobacteria bacterium]